MKKQPQELTLMFKLNLSGVYHVWDYDGVYIGILYSKQVKRCNGADSTVMCKGASEVSKASVPEQGSLRSLF